MFRIKSELITSSDKDILEMSSFSVIVGVGNGASTLAKGLAVIQMVKYK
jgi:hypothetical protein